MTGPTGPGERPPPVDGGDDPTDLVPRSTEWTVAVRVAVDAPDLVAAVVEQFGASRHELSALDRAAVTLARARFHAANRPAPEDPAVRDAADALAARLGDPAPADVVRDHDRAFTLLLGWRTARIKGLSSDLDDLTACLAERDAPTPTPAQVLACGEPDAALARALDRLAADCVVARTGPGIYRAGVRSGSLRVLTRER